MKTSSVDPRDAALHLVPSAWRVYCYERGGDGQAAASDEHRLTEQPDVVAVAAWAREEARGRDTVIYAEVSTPDGLVLVRLHGAEPE